jgi:carboxymethylenebutenolidase
VDLFEGRKRAVCMARMFVGAMAPNLDHYGIPALKAALGRLAAHPGVDAAWIGAVGFCPPRPPIPGCGCSPSTLTTSGTGR